MKRRLMMYATFATAVLTSSGALAQISVNVHGPARPRTVTAPTSTPARARIDAKAVLNVRVGDYRATRHTGPLAELDTICSDGAVSTIDWQGSGDELALHIGERLTFLDFNLGLKVDAQPDYPDHCIFNRSTQTLNRRLVHDVFANCDSQTSTQHTEIQFRDDTVEITYQLTVSRRGRAASPTTTTCTLRRNTTPAAR